MSRLYTYVKNQYLLGGFSASDLEILVSRGVITEAERLEILALKKQTTGTLSATNGRPSGVLFF